MLHRLRGEHVILPHLEGMPSAAPNMVRTARPAQLIAVLALLIVVIVVAMVERLVHLALMIAAHALTAALLSKNSSVWLNPDVGGIPPSNARPQQCNLIIYFSRNPPAPSFSHLALLLPGLHI
jgi:hypothetical protein